MNTATAFFNKPPKPPRFYVLLFMVELIAVVIHSKCLVQVTHADSALLGIIMVVAGLMIINVIRETLQYKRQATPL